MARLQLGQRKRLYMVLKDYDVIIFMICGCGLGDQYTSILSAVHLRDILIEKGYNVMLAWNKNNLYFSSEISLTNLYDFNSLNSEVFEFLSYEIDSIFGGFEKVTKFKTCEVFVKQKDDFIDNFQEISYYRSHWDWCRDRFIQFDTQFLKNDIIEISNNFLSNKDNFKGIHFRISDDYSHTDVNHIKTLPYYGNELIKLEKYLKNHKSELFMVCSNNIDLLSHLSKNHDNIFVNDLTYNLRRHNLFKNYNGVVENEILIDHTKQILAEMVCFRHCEKIYSANTFPSNFVSYGIIHNIHTQPWFLNHNNMILNINE